MPLAGSLTLLDVAEKTDALMTRAVGAIGQGGILWPR